MENKQIIRTSDRGRYRRCKQLWDFESPLRHNYRYQGTIKPLDFGIAIHEALDEFYRPRVEGYEYKTYPRDVLEHLSIATFRRICDEQKKRVLDTGATLAVEVEEDFNERVALGQGMLEHYFEWSAENDNFTVVKSEIEFEVEIPGIDAVYQGRIDAIIQDERGRYWLMDHKTAAQFGDTTWLDLDTQISAYCWAVNKQLGVKLEGLVYNELKKSVPKPPSVNKNGTLSQNKAARTSYHLYKQAIRDLGLNESDYAEYLEYLKAKSNYFRRTYISRSPAELERVELYIRMEAQEMLNPEVLIYPNPSRFNCSSCAFLAPCLAMQDGSDVKWILNSSGNYAKGVL